MNEIKVLRQLAGEYFILSQQDRFKENRKLHRAVNDLKQIRPVVLIDELPWVEMNIDDELTLRCADPALRRPGAEGSRVVSAHDDLQGEASARGHARLPVHSGP